MEFRFNVWFLISLRPKAIAAKNTCSWRLSLLRAGEGFTDSWLCGGLKPGAYGVPCGGGLLMEQEVAGTLDDGEPGRGQRFCHFFRSVQRDEAVLGSVDDRCRAGDGRQNRAEIGALHDCLLLSEKGLCTDWAGHGAPGG